MERLKNLPEIMRMNRRVRCAAQGCVGLKPTRPRFLIPPVVRMRALWGIVSVLGENKNIFFSHIHLNLKRKKTYQILEMKLYVFES